MLLLSLLRPKKIFGVPTQKKGAYHDTESIKCFDTVDKALKAYELVCNKFLSINKWKVYCGSVLADFKLYNSKGYEIDSIPEKGDFVRISIAACPNPGNPYFWVRIQDISIESSTDIQKILIVFEPSYKPTGNRFYIEHFYSRFSTSTFMICREHYQIKAAVYGRNEIPNLNAPPINIIRNIFTALLAIAGLSKLHWKKFTDGLIDLE